MTLTNNEQKLLKEIEKESVKEIKKYGEYNGYPIPLNHPRNDLTPKQAKIFHDELTLAKSLVKKGKLKVIQTDRTLMSFDLK